MVEWPFESQKKSYLKQPKQRPKQPRGKRVALWLLWYWGESVKWYEWTQEGSQIDWALWARAQWGVLSPPRFLSASRPSFSISNEVFEARAPAFGGRIGQFSDGYSRRCGNPEASRGGRPDLMLSRNMTMKKERKKQLGSDLLMRSWKTMSLLTLSLDDFTALDVRWSCTGFFGRGRFWVRAKIIVMKGGSRWSAPKSADLDCNWVVQSRDKECLLMATNLELLVCWTADRCT